jgi:ABC-2 type transport system permease protein
MHGGNVLWLIDPVRASLDSLMNAERALVFPYNLNLDDLFFTYGVRINSNLVMDMNALPIPLRTGQIGGQSQIRFFPWPYYPILHPIDDHPIVRNLNAIKTEFISSIDTLAVRNIHKKVLLKTSQYSNLVAIPSTISLDMVNDKIGKESYRSGMQNVAVLLEGGFTSVFKNRISPINLKGFSVKEESETAKMIIISDGDIIKNQTHISTKEPLPLGYDQFTNQTFGNKDLILNLVNYLTDGSDLIKLRSREVKLRLLDKAKVREEAFYWKMINVVVPIILIILFGIVYSIYRKRKYSSFK